jgi:transposase-like protein
MKKKMCPQCGSENITFNPWLGQIWTCQHCGYRGPIDLTEDGKLDEKDKRILRYIKEDLKNENPERKKDGNYKKYLVMILAVMILILIVGPLYGLIAGFLFLIYSVWDEFLKR